MIWHIYKHVRHALPIIAMIGMIGGVWQYFEKQRQGRVEYTMRLLDKFNSAPFTTFRSEINKATTNNAIEISDAARNSKEQLSDVISKIVRDQVDLDSHLSIVFEFFDAVSVCARNNLCDAETVDDFFFLYARTQYHNFYQYIVSQRHGLKSANFAKGIEDLVTKPRPSRGILSTWRSRFAAL